MLRKLTLLMCGALLAFGARSLLAQIPPEFQDGTPPGQGFATQEDPLSGFGNLVEPSGGFMGPKVEFSAWYEVQSGGRDGRLSLKALIQPGWHIYSRTQPPGGPRPTEIAVDPSPGFQVVGDFEPDRDPIDHPDPAFPGVKIEEFSDEVTWTAPIRLAADADPATLPIHITINGQVCETGGSCDLISNQPVQAQFAGFLQANKATTKYKDPSGHITIAGHIEPKIAAPGETVQLVLTADMQPNWHVYRYAPTDPEQISKPTLITLRKVAGWDYDSAEASVKPKEEESGLDEEPILYYHEGTVSWTIPIHVPKSAEPGEYPIAGGIGYQTCTPSGCDLPSGANFTGTISVSKQAVKGRAPLEFTAAEYSKIAKEAERIAKERKRKVVAQKSWLDDLSIVAVMAIAFAAGLILNVMPCVLPVIGLKIMSFVHQAGGSRGEILSLNLWFSLGLLSVFWVLGAAAAFAGHTWGEHFQDIRFVIAMIAIVFAFGLSFLGVWEIPIPGFVGSSAMQGAAEREGAIGAFSKGILSTILATPCAGPLIGPAVGWAIKQPTWLTFTAFTFVGLGMAAPYLVVGAFPRLVNLLPKPGAWMEVFKQFMGFVLMGTVVFLFMSVPGDYVVPTLILLLGIALGCWLIGMLPLTAQLNRKAITWAGSLGLMVLSWLLGFVVLAPGEGIAWQPFTRVALEQRLEEGSTVLVDFTANW